MRQNKNITYGQLFIKHFTQRIDTNNKYYEHQIIKQGLLKINSSVFGNIDRTDQSLHNY